MNIVKRLLRKYCGCDNQQQLDLTKLSVLLCTRECSCDTCPLESNSCFKLHFADRVICVEPADKARKLPRPRKFRKPNPKI